MSRLTVKQAVGRRPVQGCARTTAPSPLLDTAAKSWGFTDLYLRTVDLRGLRMVTCVLRAHQKLSLRNVVDEPQFA